MQVVTGSNAQFGLIPEEHWKQPDWIDEEKAKKGRTMLAAANVKYAGMFSVLFVTSVSLIAKP